MTENVYIFDSEVTKHDWLFVFKEFRSGEFSVFHNDNDAVVEFMKRNPLLGGFNNKHYDNHILKAVLCSFSPEEVKAVNDSIIVDKMSGWDIPSLKEHKVYFDSFDLMDDCQKGTSLKSFEAHLGIPIEETQVDFNIDRPWTEDELKTMVHYCKYDVDATEILFKIRKTYLENKITLGASCGLYERKALYMTNAKLTSVYLQARKPDKPWKDERQYKYPSKLLKQYIPQEVFDFFNKMYDENLSDSDIFGSSLEIMVGDCPCTIAYGGIHGAIPTYYEQETETRSIRNKDVASYYPHLMTLPLSDGEQYGYCSRNIPSPEIFIKTLEDRVKAKKAGDSATANALKLVLNTTYGAMLNGKGDIAYNDLYDPLMGRSVCITGQLFLLELAEHLLAECKTLKIIQLNTDGIMVSLDNTDEPLYQEITQEWQDRTKFTLEEDFIHKIIQKDVNNYCEIPIQGTPKVKGLQLVRGVLTNGKIDFPSLGYANWSNLSGGAFKINNDSVAVADAIKQYFIDGTDPETYIETVTDIRMFQLIAKASSLYSRSFQIVDGEEVPTQKVNRVYATKERKNGTLYKVKAGTGEVAKIAGLPDHCIIDNDNQLSIDAIDKSWYVKLAKRYINDFLGIKPPKKNTRRINSLKKKSLKILDNMKEKV